MMKMYMAATKFRGVWYADFRFDQKRYRRKSPEDSKRGAEAYERFLIQKLLSGESVNKQNERQKTFGEFVKDWFKTYVLTNNKLSEQQSKETILRIHLKPFFGELKLGEITSRHIDQFKRKQQAEGLNPKTINNQIAVLSKIFHSAVEWGDLDNIPVMKLLRVPAKKIRFLDENECTALLADQVEPMWSQMITTAIHTGMRMGELMGLQWEDIDFDRHVITVRRSIVRGEITSPKSHKSRTIPMTKQLDDLLYSIRQKRGLVFWSKESVAIMPKQAVCALWRVCARTGVDRIGWHALRHTFASRLVMRGVPIRHVQQLLGHSSVTMTERYSHLSPGVLHDAVAVLELPNGYFGNNMGTQNSHELILERKTTDPTLVSSLN